MNKIKVIDLLNMISKGEEVPKKIKWENIIYAYSEYDKDYLECPFSDEEYKGLFDMRDNILTQFLNDEVEIIEEEPKPITKESIEALGYACGEIRKCFENGWNKSLENKPLIEEPKKIEKLDEILMINDLIPPYGENEYKAWKNIIIQQNKINELIDEINNLKEKKEEQEK